MLLIKQQIDLNFHLMQNTSKEAIKTIDHPGLPKF